MTSPTRSDHLTIYGLVGVATHAVIGVLVVASWQVIPGGWMAALLVAWLAGSVAGAALWKRTVWVPLVASLLVAGLWMGAFFANR